MRYQGLIWAGVYVQDLEAAIGFYRDVLKLPLLSHGADWALLDAGRGALLELETGGVTSQAVKTNSQQPIVVGLRVPDLDQAMAEMKQAGVKFIGEIGSYKNTRWAHFSDLEGNRLEIKEVPE